MGNIAPEEALHLQAIVALAQFIAPKIGTEK
jgi:hypothetical protein